jgi:type III secretion system YscD/HrpQ family protein
MRQLRILSGLHQGAAVTLGEEARCLVGSDAQCSVVLLDKQVAPRHCLVQVDAFGSSCRALDASIAVGERQLAAGEVAKLDDFAVVRCGDAALSVGPSDGDWTLAERALQEHTPAPLRTLRTLRQLNPYALFAVVLLGITFVIGLAYAALSDGSFTLTPDRVAAARGWLKGVAPSGSELSIGADTASPNQLLLTGYVRDEQQLRALLTASRSSGFAPRVEVYTIDDMTGSMARLVRLGQLPCELQYQGAGQFSCADPVPSDAVAMKLRMLARDVPGVRALHVNVVPPPPVVAEAAPPAPKIEDPVLRRKFSVLMFRNQRFLIGPFGERYKEGEQFDGFTINRIGVDRIMFERDGRQFEFYVAALRVPP